MKKFTIQRNKNKRENNTHKGNEEATEHSSTATGGRKTSAFEKTTNEEIDSKWERAEKILRYSEPPNSFLYRNRKKKSVDDSETEPHQNSYVIMNSTNTQKRTIVNKMSQYINFDINRLARFSVYKRNPSFDDRGYYDLKRTSYAKDPPVYDVIDYNNKSNENKYFEEVDGHLYEDVDYYKSLNKRNEVSRERKFKIVSDLGAIKINDVFSSIKFPVVTNCLNAKDTNTPKEVIGKVNVEVNGEVNSEVNGANGFECNEHVYDVCVSTTGNYQTENDFGADYLEPVQLHYKDYGDVVSRQTLTVNSFLKSIENRFRTRSDNIRHNLTPNTSDEESPEKPLDVLRKWIERLRANEKADKTNMAARPLPVPVEDEPYFRQVDRGEAARILEGQCDGTFILRPSSQPFYLYTLSLVHQTQVHNVGVRRRGDGGVALGVSKRGESHFPTVQRLVQYYSAEWLSLVVGGRKIGNIKLRRLECSFHEVGLDELEEITRNSR